VGSAGACPALPVVTDGLPPPPAPPSSGGGTETVRVHIAPDFCEVYGELRPGVRVQLEAGSGCSPTAERRAAVTAANMPGFYVDGVPVGGVFYESEVYGLVSQCYTMETHAYWIATPGTHGFTQDGRLTDGDMTTCLFTVPE